MSARAGSSRNGDQDDVLAHANGIAREPRDLRKASRVDSPASGTRDMVWIEGGTFRMGSDRHYPEEAPARDVRVDGFLIDRTLVTNRQFATFAAATGYRTVAERPIDPGAYPGARPDRLKPGSMVFRQANGPVDLRDIRNWWAWTQGAYWRHPEGRRSSVALRLDHPVVHVAHEDALAYSRWAGKVLPTEAEWEFAACGGLADAEFAWGDAFEPGGHRMANTWQGEFPWKSLTPGGQAGTSRVGRYPANGFGLLDMVGNVWEWTNDDFSAGPVPDKGTSCCSRVDPQGGFALDGRDPVRPGIRVIPSKVVKGGSFLCSPSYCRRYRPAARHAQMVDSGMSHIGFRCVLRLHARMPKATYDVFDLD